MVGRVFRYAIATGRAKHDISMDLRGALAPRATRNHPSITDPVKVGQLLRAIDGYEGQIATHAALRIAPYVFVRPGELRAAEWSEFNLDACEWRIPGERMKMGEQHVVPLATQVVGILRELQPVTGCYVRHYRRCNSLLLPEFIQGLLRIRIRVSPGQRAWNGGW